MGKVCRWEKSGSSFTASNRAHSFPFSELLSNKASYSSLCCARSALSSYLGIGSFGSLDCVQRFMKGAFETNPTLPSERKIVTWDPQRVLDFLEPRFPHDTLTVKELTLKLTLFLAILSGQRSQTIHALDIDNMAVSNKR